MKENQFKNTQPIIDLATFRCGFCNHLGIIESKKIDAITEVIKNNITKLAKQELLKEIIDYGCENDDYTYDEIIEFFINKYEKPLEVEK